MSSAPDMASSTMIEEESEGFCEFLPIWGRKVLSFLFEGFRSMEELVGSRARLGLG